MSDVVALKAVGVSAASVDDLCANGLDGLDASDLVALRANGIDGAYIRRLRAHGLTALSASDLLALKAQGIGGTEPGSEDNEEVTDGMAPPPPDA